MSSIFNGLFSKVRLQANLTAGIETLSCCQMSEPIMKSRRITIMAQTSDCDMTITQYCPLCGLTANSDKICKASIRLEADVKMQRTEKIT